MAITASPYGLSYRSFGYGRFDFLNHTFKVLLTSAAYTPDFDTHEFRSDVTNELPGGGGYTSGGKTLTNLSWLYEPDNNQVVLRCDPVTWTAASFSARRAVVYRDTGNLLTSPLLSWVDFGANAAPDGVDWPIVFNNGVYIIRTATA